MIESSTPSRTVGSAATGSTARLLLVVLLLASGTTLASAAPFGEQESISRAERVRALLAFAAEDTEGRLWTHDRLEGRIVLLDFWATWCAPCVAELPYLKRARSRYGDRFEIVGVALDRVDGRRLASWLREHAVSWPQIHRKLGFDDRLAREFGIERLPTNLLLDRKGRLRALDVRGEALFREIDRLLAEESGSRR